MRKSKFTPAMQEQFITDLATHYDADVVTTQQVLEFVKKQKMDTPYFFFRDESRKVGRGKYRVRGSVVAKAVAAQIPESAAAMAPLAQVVNLASKRATNVT